MSSAISSSLQRLARGAKSAGARRVVVRARAPPASPMAPLAQRHFSSSPSLRSEEKPSSKDVEPELEELIRQEKEKIAEEDAEEHREEKEAAAGVKEELIEETEKPVGEAKMEEFQAETKKILDIVARSLYSDKEIFLRELVSNASDAMEKVRHMMMLGKNVTEPDLPLELRISVDDKKKTIIIQDTGIGMTKAELQRNLGRIGFSGTAEFVRILEDKAKSSSMIGQFGVGFYSAFMVATKIKVYSKGYTEEGDRGWVWESDGSGTYTLGQAEPVQRGTKIVIYLRQDCEEFAVRQTLENVIKTHSNFIGFPIILNGRPVNTVKALWTLNPQEVTPEMHKEFYQFISKAYDAPLYTVHFSTDIPLQLRSLFYVPETHMEKYGMGRQELGINLYSRKVLIQAKCKGLVPDWLRFVKGVVDSEDVPLNLSREHLQDSALIKRLSGVITRRIIKFLEKEAKDEPEKYAKFYGEFSPYIKEGVCTDYVNKEEIAKLLRMESSHTEAGKTTSIEEYVDRMKKDQKDIFFLIVPNRQFAEQSPYFESFKAADLEVLFLYDTRLDDFVMSNLADFKGKKLKTIESSAAAEALKQHIKEEDKAPKLSPDEFKDFARWMKDVLVDKVTTVTETERLANSPCIVVDHESASFRRMMKAVDPKNAPELPKQQVQVNPRHPIILAVNELRRNNPSSELARDAIAQVFDNALIQAGLIDDSRSMVPRINKLLTHALDALKAAGGMKPHEVAAAHRLDVEVPPAPELAADPFVAPAAKKADL